MVFLKFRALFSSPDPYPSGLQITPVCNHCSPGCLQFWCHRWVHLHRWPSSPVTHPFGRGCLLQVSGNYPLCITRIPWIAYSLLSYFSSRCWGGWSPPRGQRPCEHHSAWSREPFSRCRQISSFCCLGLWFSPSSFQLSYGCSSETTLHTQSRSWCRRQHLHPSFLGSLLWIGGTINSCTPVQGFILLCIAFCCLDL